jgi:ectoine hydroxylase-related dioxygenase (phytanoyl-CoA dioxygenase family)
MPDPGLTDAQVAQFWEQGFISGIPVLTEAQTQTARLRFQELEAQARDSAGPRWADDEFAPWNIGKHPLRSWFHAMSTHPRILAAVSSILGPNLLIRNGDVFMKDPGNSRRIGWHVDSTASVAESKLMVTAWLSMSHSSRANGCVEFLPGSHEWPLPERNRDKHNLSLKGDALQALEGRPTVYNLMRPGQLSIHCFRTLHRSWGNSTQVRRFGYVTRFVAPEVSPEGAECGQAHLALGDNAPARVQLRPTFPVWWRRSDSCLVD